MTMTISFLPKDPFQSTTEEHTMTNNPSPENSLFDNPSPRCPCLLVLDTSGSMDGSPIRELSDGLGQFIGEVKRDEVAASSVELGIISFGGDVTLCQQFSTIAELDSMPSFQASGNTPMGEAVTLAVDILDKRKHEYQQAGVSYYQPWLVLMSDGEPTDAWVAAAASLRQLAEKRKMVVLCVGIGDGANMECLAQFSTMPPKRLAGLKFAEFFEWLSQSMQRVSASIPGDRISLPSTGGWDSIQI